MAAPALEKTWQKAFVSVPSGTGPSPQTGASAHDTQYRACMFGLVDALRSFASGAWTVVSSCGYDSGSWSYGAADYWVTAEDVRFKEITGGQFSWIVLQQNGIKTGFQLLISLDENDAAHAENPMSFRVSTSGSFTGGNATTRPTASDEISFTEYIRMWEDGSYECAFNVWMSTDGACTRFCNSMNGVIKHVFCFEKLKNMADSSVFTGQSICGCLRTQTNWDLFSYGATSYKVHFAAGHECTWMGLTPMLTSVAPIDTSLKGPDPNGDYPAIPVQVFSDSPIRFMAGQMYDCLAVSTDLNDGDMFPADNSNLFVVLGDFVIGNDGTELVLP